MTAQTKNNKNFSHLTSQFSSQRGFTLIELLVVIGILAILLAITLIAINPARQFQQARDTERQSDVNQILNAVGQYSVDGANDLDTIIDATNCTSGAPCTIGNTTGANPVGNAFCTELAPTYIAAIPADPQAANGGDPYEAADCTGSDTWETDYTVYRGADDRVTVGATGEITTTIEVTR